MQYYEVVAVSFHSSVLTLIVARDVCFWCNFRIIHLFLQMQLILRDADTASRSVLFTAQCCCSLIVTMAGQVQ